MFATKRHASVVALAFLACVAAPFGPLRAETCLEQVEGLAARYNLEILPPPSTSPTLRGRSGVITPPLGYDPKAVRPPPVSGDAMPTTPEIEPDAPPGAQTGPSGMDASERLRLAAILTAARSAALRGDQAACLQRLGAATSLVERSSEPPG